MVHACYPNTNLILMWLGDNRNLYYLWIFRPIFAHFAYMIESTHSSQIRIEWCLFNFFLKKTVFKSLTFTSDQIGILFLATCYVSAVAEIMWMALNILKISNWFEKLLLKKFRFETWKTSV